MSPDEYREQAERARRLIESWPRWKREYRPTPLSADMRGGMNPDQYKRRVRAMTEKRVIERILSLPHFGLLARVAMWRGDETKWN